MSEVEEISDERMAQQWCILNRMEWPEDIPVPAGFEDHNDPGLEVYARNGANAMRRGHMRQIVEKIGKDKCLEEWNRGRPTHPCYPS